MKLQSHHYWLMFPIKLYMVFKTYEYNCENFEIECLKYYIHRSTLSLYTILYYLTNICSCNCFIMNKCCVWWTYIGIFVYSLMVLVTHFKPIRSSYHQHKNVVLWNLHTTLVVQTISSHVCTCNLSTCCTG